MLSYMHKKNDQGSLKVNIDLCYWHREHTLRRKTLGHCRPPHSQMTEEKIKSIRPKFTELSFSLHSLPLSTPEQLNPCFLISVPQEKRFILSKTNLSTHALNANFFNNFGYIVLFSFLWSTFVSADSSALFNAVATCGY